MEDRKGFEKLKEFFANLPKHEVLLENKGKPVVDMSWVFTETLDRTVISEAITRIMMRNNPTYESKCKRFNRDPKNITQIRILNDVMEFLGNDGWTKLNVADKPLETDKNGIPTISVEELEQEVLKVLKEEPLNKILEQVDLEETQREQITTIFNETLQGEGATLKGINEALDSAFTNLVDYYKYLIKLKKEHNTHSCTIKQREDEGGEHKKGDNIAKPRVNEIIPFNERAEILEAKSPVTKVEVAELDKEGNEIPNSYTAYVYDKCLRESGQEQDGYLFVCEPLQGTRRTRLVYLTKEEFGTFPIQQGEDKYSKITEKYLSMSTKEFNAQKGTHYIKHTKLDTYKDRLEVYLHGIRGKSIIHPQEYEEHLKRLYKNPNISIKKYSRNDIAGMAGKTLGIDRTAQEKVRGDNQKVNH